MADTVTTGSSPHVADYTWDGLPTATLDGFDVAWDGPYGTDHTVSVGVSFVTSDGLARSTGLNLSESLAILAGSYKWNDADFTWAEASMDWHAHRIDVGLLFIRELFEALGVSDSILNAAGYSRSLAEALVLADAAVRAAGKEVASPLSLTETRAVTLTLQQARALGVASAVGNTPGKRFSEAFAASDTHGLQWTAVRELAETLGLTETLAKALASSLAEALAVTESGATEADKQLAEALALASASAAAPTKQLAETLALTEAERRDVARSITETLSLAEAHSDVASFSREIAEALVLAEQAATGASKALAESWTVGESVSDTASFIRSFGEALAVAEAGAREFGLQQLRSIAVGDSNAMDLAKQLTETMALAEVLLKALTLPRTENLALADAGALTPNKQLAETLSVVSARSAQTTKAVVESAAFAEALGRVVTYSRTLAESLGVAEATQRASTLNKTDAFALGDLLRRNAKAVISDILVKASGDIDSAAFATLLEQAEATGYGPFVPFMEGDHEYKNAIFKATVAAQASSRLRLDELKVQVDVPDVFDSGLASVPAGGLTVAFNRPFYETPEINVVLKGGTSFGIPRVQAITLLDFRVDILDASGTSVAGNVSWAAHGY